MRRLLTLLSILLFPVYIVFADVEMTINFQESSYIRGALKWKNRQDKYYWNNDLLTIHAVGIIHGSTPINPLAHYDIDTYQTLSKDADNFTQYRFLYTRGEKVSLLPGEEETYGPENQVLDLLLESLDANCPYPRYPHIVIREKPWFGLKFTNTNIYAPPLTYTDIDPSTGAVIGQNDYYDPNVWFARDDAPFMVDTNHHPTQLWIGTPHILTGDKVEDAADPADYFDEGDHPDANSWSIGDIKGMRGSYITPNSPDGVGVSYNHQQGSGPGGLMLAMSVAWGQEIFGVDMRVPLTQGAKESWFLVFWDDSYPSFPEWGYAGTHPNYGGGACNSDPYQTTDNDRIQIAFQTMPDYYDHSAVYVQAYPNINVNMLKTNIVNATVTFYLTTIANFYVYLSASRAHRLDEFAEQATDPFSLFRIVGYAYNQGPNLPNHTIPDMRYGALRNEYLASKNLSISHNMVGGYGYCPKIIDLSRRIGRCPDVYDWGITWGDVQDLLKDLREVHYVNGIPSDAQWNAMSDDLEQAFSRMKGKAPTEGLGSDQISYRYNWLTMIRIMKSYIPNPRTYFGKGSTFHGNVAPFMGPYVPQYAFNITGDVNDWETQPTIPDTNFAPEIYWITPRHPLPTTEQAFPVIDDNIMNNIPLKITADILDDGVGVGELTARYCVSPGDPSNNGQSMWRDGEVTGGTVMNPVATDWVEMKDIGPSQTPSGGRRFHAVFDASNIQNEVRRIYVEANDNCGYRTISWVDVFFKDDGLPDLVITAIPGDGAHFKDDTTIVLTVTCEGDTINDAVIYYTIGGSDPDTTNPSQIYSGPFIISGDTVTVKAIAICNGYTPAFGAWTYYQELDNVAWIDADPDSGTHFGLQLEITLSTNVEKIYYSTDGTEPDTTDPSQLYTGPFFISGDIVTVKGIAIGSGYIPATGTWIYYRNYLPDVIADPEGQEFIDTIKVTLSLTGPWPGAKIYYTLDGSPPDTNNSNTFLFDGTPIVITETTTLKAQAFAPDAMPSNICIEIYILAIDIKIAYYRDGDGNGGIDMAELILENQPTTFPTTIALTNPFDDSDTKIVTSDNIKWLNDDSTTLTIIVTLVSPFPYNSNTYFEEADYGQILYSDSLKRAFSIKDGVAPVIDRAIYCPGEIISTHPVIRTPDTLIIAFSEEVHDIDYPQPFELIATYDETGYYFDLAQIGRNANLDTFIVEANGIHGVDYPVDGDSIWIDTAAGILDIYSNKQGVEDNRHVRLTVKPKPILIVVSVLTPFKIGIGNSPIPDELKDIAPIKDGMFIIVDFFTDLSNEVSDIGCKMAIYDPVGNLVVECNEINDMTSNLKMVLRTADENTQIIIFWAGCNENGRYVGGGTFIGKIQITPPTGRGDTEVKDVMIGVKR